MLVGQQCSLTNGKQVMTGIPMQADFSNAVFGRAYTFEVKAYVMDDADELLSTGRVEAPIQMCKCLNIA